MGVQTADQLPGVFSSRKLERATYDSVAFRFIAVNQHPRGERLLLRQFCRACIIATCGYDFQEGQERYPARRSRAARPSGRPILIITSK